MLKFLQSNLKGAVVSLWVAVSLFYGLPIYATSDLNDYDLTAVQQERITLKDAISRIEQQMNYKFAYTTSDVDLNMQVEYSNSNDIKVVLDKMFAATSIVYNIKGSQIILTQKKPFKLIIRVIDEDDKPVVGATVVARNNSIGSVTSARGEVTINNAMVGMKFEISYVGMTTQNLKIDQPKPLEVVRMQQDVTLIENVVVTGYQTISKERATGSFNIVSRSQVDKPATLISERLVGTTAGVVASPNTITGELEFEIRGKTSLNANAQPLIVVDGFAVEDGFKSVNPNDVESVTILKDASAASIWGARSANGVIVITTKKAKAGKVSISISGFYKFSKKLDLDYLRVFANTSDVIDYELAGFQSDFFGGPWSPVTDGVPNVRKGYSEAVIYANEYKLGHITKDQYDAAIAQLRNQDNTSQIRDNMLVNPSTKQYNLTISGGTEKMNNSLSLLFSDANNNFKHNSNNEYLINYKTQVKVVKWLDFNFGGTFQYRNTKDGGLSAGSIENLSPYENLLNPDGSYADVTYRYYMPMVERLIPRNKFAYSDWTYNPLREANNTKLNTKDINSRIQAGLTAEITKGLTINSSIQYEIFNKSINNIYNEETFFVKDQINTSSTWDQTINGTVKANLPKGGFRDRSVSSISSYNFRNQLNFVRTFADKHALNVVAGTELLDRTAQDETNPRTYGYNDTKLTVGTFPNGFEYRDMWGNKVNVSYISRYAYSQDRYFSAYGNAAYTYDNRYTLSASLRTDASNIISDDPKYRYSPFWSIGGSWNIHNEKLFNVEKYFDRLILRATYGYNGNVDKTTAFMPLISMGSSQNIYTQDYTASISSFGNPTLRWEKTGTFNLGLDFAMFGNKLTCTIDYYRKKGKDLIVSMTIPSVNGTTSQKLNNGEMENNGFEIKLGSSLPILDRDIVWSGEATFAYNKNRITKFYKAYYNAYDLYYGGTSAYIEGYDANTIWSYNYAGVKNFGTEAAPDYKPVIQGLGNDQYGFDGWTPGDGRPYVFDQGSSVAPITASLSSSFKIYDFDLSFIATGKFGHSFRRTGFNYPSMSSGKALPNKYLQEVKQGGANKFVPIPQVNERYYFWDRFYPYMSYLTESASHIRIQEISLVYTLPKNITNKLGFGSLKLYAQANNVGTILFNNFGEDPEYMYGSIKPLATYTFGFKLNF